jgi:hypothetical protein
MRKKERYDKKKAVRKMARERVGIVKASRAIEPKPNQKKPKYKKPPETDAE